MALNLATRRDHFEPFPILILFYYCMLSCFFLPAFPRLWWLAHYPFTTPPPPPRYSGQKLKANIAMPPLCPPRMTKGILPFPFPASSSYRVTHQVGNIGYLESSPPSWWVTMMAPTVLLLKQGGETTSYQPIYQTDVSPCMYLMASAPTPFSYFSVSNIYAHNTSFACRPALSDINVPER